MSVSVCSFTHNLVLFIVYQKGDIVMEPMNSRDVLPKNVPGWGGVWWGGSCRGGVGWGGVGHVGVGWGGVGWVM